MEWWKADRASTMPSSRVTQTQHGAPSRKTRNMRLVNEPWK